MKFVKTTVTFTYYSLVEDDPEEAADFVDQAASDVALYQECDHEVVELTNPVTLQGDWSLDDLVYHSIDRDEDITVRAAIEKSTHDE